MIILCKLIFVQEFTKIVDVVTYEFENIPIDILEQIDKEKKVLPNPNINKIVQNRRLEKKRIVETKLKIYKRKLTQKWTKIKIGR